MNNQFEIETELKDKTLYKINKNVDTLQLEEVLLGEE